MRPGPAVPAWLPLAAGPDRVPPRLELDHLEAQLPDVVLDRVDAVLDAAAGVVDEAADKAVRILAHHLGRVAHIHVDGLGATALAVGPGIDGVALRRLDEGLVDAARLAVDGVRPVHHPDQALPGKWIAIVAPRQVDQIRRITAGVDDHGRSPNNDQVGQAHAAARQKGRPACCFSGVVVRGALEHWHHRRNTPSVSNLQLNVAALHRCCPIDRFYPRGLYT